ncbi:MAG: PAS domain S-box protein [Syntrophorhabdales bacterium]|jgi:PAS domain S-box-containing protein
MGEKKKAPGNRNYMRGIRSMPEQRRVKYELRGIKGFLRTVLNNAYDAIFIHDLQGRVIDLNDKMLAMYRVDREEAKNLFIVDDFSAPENRLEELPLLWEKVVSGQDQFFEWKAKRPRDGSSFDVEVALTKISLPHGDFILANVRDITERKQVERELQATRDYLRTVFNNVYDAIFIHDLNGKVIDVNHKMLDLYKVSRKEATELSIIPDYSTPNYATDRRLSRWALSNWERVISGENQFFEWKARRPRDGYEFDVEVFLTKVSLPNGDFILANVRDITERKRMEALLVKEGETFFSVMKNNPHGIALFNNDGTFVYFNPEFTNITGYTLEDIPTGRDWSRRAYPDPEYRAKTARFWKADKRSEGRGKDVEWRVACKNGQYKDVEFRVTYLGDKSLVVLTDTTARKRAEEELRAEKHKFQTLTENSPMGIMMVGADECNKYINPKFRELFGYDLADIPSTKEWFTRAYPDPFYRHQAKEKWACHRKPQRAGEGKPYTRKVRCKDGTVKYINLIPVQLETGEIIMTYEDITESKEAGDKLRERNLELEILNDIIGSVSNSLHLPEILQSLKKVFVEKLAIPVGGIFLYGEFSSRSTMEICWGMPEGMYDDFDNFVLRGYGAGTIVRENEVTVTKNHMEGLGSVDFLLSRFLKKWYTSLYIPLVAENEIQGMVILMNEDPDFPREQIDFFGTLGQQIGVVIQNARLFSKVRESHRQMKALSLRIVEVQEAERRYIARELHDEIGQQLTGLKLAIEMNMLRSEGKVKADLMEAKSVVNRILILVRELSLNLRPSMLDDLGLLLTLPWHFERFTSQTHISVSFKHTGLNDKRFPLEVETAVYRIVQEGLTNIARHAGVDEAEVRLWSDEKTVGVQIVDRGVGFDADLLSNPGSTSGLHGMRERAVLLGGRLAIETGPGCGTRLTAELPVTPDNRAMDGYERYHHDSTGG